MTLTRKMLILLVAVLMAVAIAIPPVAAQTDPDPGCPPGTFFDPITDECVPLGTGGTNPTPGDPPGDGDDGDGRDEGGKDDRDRNGGGGGGGDDGLVLEITQENDQEAESGDVDQSFTVTSEGDNSNQCVGAQGVGNTGNVQTQTSVIQVDGDADDFEFDEVDSSVEVSPTSDTTCDQQVDQAASASG